ncbi:MAG: IS1 family transposase [Bacteroidetes bacterium]|nr:IS1 family transposase [Bacteroidota bacterium]
MKPTNCPNCSSTRFTKFGTREGKLQRYRCLDCRYRFTGETIVRKKDTYYKTKALQLWLEGLTYIAIGKLIGFSDDSVAKWMKPYVEKLEPLRLDRKKLTRKVKQYEKIIYVDGVNAHSSGIIVNGFESHVFGVSRRPHKSIAVVR